MHPFSTPENIRKPYDFLMFSDVEKQSIENKCVKHNNNIVPLELFDYDNIFIPIAT